MSESGARPGGDRREHPLRRTEDLYRLLVENIRDYAIFVLDPEGRVASWNRGAERIKGYGEAEVLGRHYSMFYPPEAVREGEPDHQLEVAATEGRFEGEGWRLRKDGTRFWAHVVLTALHNDAGTLVGFGKITGDQTAERAAREELLRRERQLAEAQQIAGLGSWEYDIEEDRIRWSDELYRIFGLEPGSPLDLTAYAERLHPDDRERVLEVVRRAMTTGEAYGFEHRIVRPDGAVRHIQSRGEAIVDDTGRVARLVGTALDITELKRAEERERTLAAERLRRQEAERAAHRMSFLAEASQVLGSSLEYEHTLRNVARLAVPEFADWCAVDMLDANGTLERLAVAHVDPERERLGWELHERYPPDLTDPAGTLQRVLRSGRPEIIPEVTSEMIAAAARDPEHARLIAELGLRSAVIAAIRVRDDIRGAITFITAESDRRYLEDDLVIARELAIRAGLAIENADLHAAERRARRSAEQSEERMARLQAITAGLSEAVTPAAVAEVIVEQGVAGLDAMHGTLMLLNDDGRALDMVRTIGLPDAVASRYRRLPLDSEVPVATAVRSGELVLVETVEERERRFPALRHLRHESGSKAMAAVPLRSAGRIIGGLGFGYRDERTFTDEDRQFLSSLGRQCAQALERAWLYETEHLAREAAEAASRAKSQFVAMMSHELRTPLSAILGYQELLSEGIVGPVTELQREQLARIRASATHLRDLINQILSLSRIEAGREDVAGEEVDLGMVAEDVILLLEQEARSKGIELRSTLPERPVDVTTDPGKVRQILLNLVSNAIKFTDEGAVAVEMRADEDEVVVIVTDTGIGIQPADQERIFEAFTQVDQSMTRRAGGTGLGLPVSRRLATLLGGDIELESEPGRGSTFRLRLPRSRGEDDGAAHSAGPESGAG